MYVLDIMQQVGLDLDCTSPRDRDVDNRTGENRQAELEQHPVVALHGGMIVSPSYAALVLVDSMATRPVVGCQKVGVRTAGFRHAAICPPLGRGSCSLRRSRT